MKFSKKMVLVPAGRPDPANDQMSELDKQMSNILKEKSLSDHDKIRMYNYVLTRNKTIDFNAKLQNNEQIQDLIKQTQSTKPEPPFKIKDEFQDYFFKLFDDYKKLKQEEYINNSFKNENETQDFKEKEF